MAHTLADLVKTALHDADAQMKTASAVNAPSTPDLDLDAMLEVGPEKTANFMGMSGNFGEDRKKKKKDEDEKEDKEEEKTSALLSADRGLALADALDNVGTLFNQKLAAGTVFDAPGPQIMEAGRISETVKNPPTPPTAAKELPVTDRGPAGGLAVNDEGAAHATSKVAAEMQLQVKVAQCQALVDADRMELAEELYKEIQQEEAKLAASAGGSGDPGADAKLPAANESFKMPTDTNTQIVVPDNAGMISMSRDQARKKGDALASTYFMEKRKTDPAVQEHVGNHFGLKVSADKDTKGPIRMRDGMGTSIAGQFAGLGAGGLVGAGVGGLAGMAAKRLGVKVDPRVAAAAGATVGGIGGSVAGGVKGLEHGINARLKSQGVDATMKDLKVSPLRAGVATHWDRAGMVNDAVKIRKLEQAQKTSGYFPKRTAS